MTTEPRAIFARDLKPGMVVTPWSQAEIRGHVLKGALLEIVLVTEPVWSHTIAGGGGMTVKTAGWLLEPVSRLMGQDDFSHVRRVAHEFRADDSFAVIDEVDSDA